MKKIECTVEYLNSPHLAQLYHGFLLLEKKGIINLKFYQSNNSQTGKPVIRVKLNEEISLVYDTLDGLNWNNSLDRLGNMSYFASNFDCDFYFKRSYAKELSDPELNGPKVLPLGLNYNIDTEILFPSLRDHVKKLVFYFLKSKKKSVAQSDFEYYPIFNDKPRILFLARLWNPDEIENNSIVKHEREVINFNRIEFIKICKEYYGDYFTGGLQLDKFAQSLAPELCVSSSSTSKVSFLNQIKQHDICISTLGLHGSTGWKFGEYIAASRAIVSEPLVYDSPGLSEEKHYLSFSTKDELIHSIDSLFNNKNNLREMMLNNYHYYNNYLRPDSLVLNTLLIAIDNFKK